MVRPNFFIVGAIKSGSSSLASYLRRHPQVFMPGPWEFQYFADDLTWVNGEPIRLEPEYLSNFQAGAGRPRLGEKSVFYLMSKTAPARIRAFDSDAKILCILRNPVEVMWSLYRYNLANLEEELVPLDRALDAEEDRRRGRRIPAFTSILQNLYYREIVDFAPQVARYKDLFDPEHFKVLLMDDLRKDPDTTYQQVLAFLGLAPLHLKRYPRENVNTDDAILPIRRYARRHRWFRGFLDERVPRTAKEVAKRAIRSWLGPPRWARLDPFLRDRLRQEMNPKIHALGEVVGRDLTPWMSPPSP